MKTKTKMSKCTIEGQFKPTIGRFGVCSDKQKKEILRECHSENINKTTLSAVRCIEEYLIEKQLPRLELLPNEDLPGVLEDFYVNARTKKNNDLYHVQTLKCM